jgi:hypothetical protein
VGLWFLSYFFTTFPKKWDLELVFLTIVLTLLFIHTTAIWITSCVAIMKFKNMENWYEKNLIDEKEVGRRFTKLRKIVNCMLLPYNWNGFWTWPT